MPKILCLTGMALAILVFLIFLLDILFGMMGRVDLAPLRMASPIMDVLFLLAAAVIAWMAYATFREQK